MEGVGLRLEVEISAELMEVRITDLEIDTRGCARKGPATFVERVLDENEKAIGLRRFF